MTIKEIRELTGLSQQRFGGKYGIPKRTIENWENGVTAPPEYVVRLLEFKVKTERGIDMDCYIVVESQKDGLGDENVTEYEYREDAIDRAEYVWNRYTAEEQKKMQVEVIKSVNPNKDAPEHYNGDIVLLLK